MTPQPERSYSEQERVLVTMALYESWRLIESDPSGMLKAARERQEAGTPVVFISTLLELPEEVVEAALENLEGDGLTEEEQP